MESIRVLGEIFEVLAKDVALLTSGSELKGVKPSF